MAAHRVDDIRNIALAGHRASGKTSLADALLYAARAVDRRGSVDDGTSVSDYDEEENKHHFSIDSSVLHFDHKGKYVYLLDTPGYPDFVGGALAALDAVETALIVVSAANGIEVNTRRMFTEAGKRGLARMLVINKLDADNVKFGELVEPIQNDLRQGLRPVQCARRRRPHDSAAWSASWSRRDNSPAGCPVDLASARSQLVDAIVESDEALMEKYLLKATSSTEELTAALPRALAAGTVSRSFALRRKKTSASGAARCHHQLRPVARRGNEAQGASRALATRPPKWRWSRTNLRICRPGLQDAQRQVRRQPQLFPRLFRQDHSRAADFNHEDRQIVAQRRPVAHAGQEAEAVPRQSPATSWRWPRSRICTSATRSAANPTGRSCRGRPIRSPMFGLAVEPKARGDEQKISGSLHKIADEDPTFKVTRDAQTKELVITGMTQLHLDVVQHRLKRRFDLEIITARAEDPLPGNDHVERESEHQHKKADRRPGPICRGPSAHLSSQGRAASQQGAVFREIRQQDAFRKNSPRQQPLRSEHNFGFHRSHRRRHDSEQFIPAVEKGCKELLERAPWPATASRTWPWKFISASITTVDSSEAAFKTAGRMAMKKAFLAARPVLLEPIVNLEVTVPSKYTGAILGDLNTKRARIENQDSLPGDLAVIKGKVPLAEVTRYAAQLGSITQGQGSYTMEFSHYDMVPGNVQQQIVSKAKLRG